MPKLLSKEFYGNHYYLNIDSEIGSVSRLAANPWQYHQPSSSPSRQAAVRQPVRPPRHNLPHLCIIYQNQGNMRKFRVLRQFWW